MIKNIWHSTLIVGFIGFGAYILSTTNDCERIDRAVSPVRGVAHVVSWASRNWLEQTDTTGIEETGAEAGRYLARALSQTFLGPNICSFPDPKPIRATQSPQAIPADAAAQTAATISNPSSVVPIAIQQTGPVTTVVIPTPIR